LLYFEVRLPCKPIIAAFDAEGLSASGSLLTLREIEQRLGLAPRLAAHMYLLISP